MYLKKQEILIEAELEDLFILNMGRTHNLPDFVEAWGSAEIKVQYYFVDWKTDKKQEILKQIAKTCPGHPLRTELFNYLLIVGSPDNIFNMHRPNSI